MKHVHYVGKTCFVLIALHVSYASAQTVAEWKMPEIHIPLMQGKDTLAILKPTFQSKKVILTYAGIDYKMTLKRDAKRCMITDVETGELLAIAKRLGSKKGSIEFTNGQTIALTRTGKKQNRQFTLADQSSIRFSEEKISVTFQNNNLAQLITHGALVFQYSYEQYDKERGSQLYYYPIVVQ